MSNQKEFRLWFKPSIEKDPEPYITEFDDYASAKLALDEIAVYTLFLHHQKLMIGYSNIGFIQQMVDGEWEDYDDEE